MEITREIAAERERCAKIGERWSPHCAAAIRKGE
jgi:hypothetical protein